MNVRPRQECHQNYCTRKRSKRLLLFNLSWMTLYIAIACEGFSFRQEYVQDCSVFMAGFFYILSRICLHLRLKNECSSQIGMPLKVLHAQKDKECLCTFLQMHFFKCVKICAVGALTEYHYNFFCPLVVNLRSLQGRVRKVLLV